MGNKSAFPVESMKYGISPDPYTNILDPEALTLSQNISVKFVKKCSTDLGSN